MATIENRLEVITTQVSAGNLPALNRIPEIQNSACCQRPTISSPASVFSSLLISVKFKTINTVPKDLISDCMDSLSNLNLRNVDVSGLNLTGIGLHQTNLTGADCRGTNFSGKEIRYCYPPAPSWLHHVCFDSADARNADFAWAILDGVSFENSNLQHANFWNAWLRCWWILSEHVSFKGADLSYANFEHAKNIDWREIGKAKTLYNAKFDPFIDSILHKNCSQLFEKKRDKRTICTCDTVQIFVSDSLKFQYFNVDTESIGCPLCSDQAEGDTVPSMDFKQCW
ncbi:MAG TPA: pentapeptide repeat-containing protein [Chitinispirillaceae bacterium]|nr:pentapeptide repeat-containing protein [Chitinispirillaceae bacterium]